MILLFKEFSARWRRNALAFAFIFALLFAAIRGFGMLGPATVRPLIPFGFVLMMLLPFIFLTTDGRRQIGLTKSNAMLPYLAGILFGIAGASVCFGLGVLL